jgi:hypothetical protein
MAIFRTALLTDAPTVNDTKGAVVAAEGRTSSSVAPRRLKRGRQSLHETAEWAKSVTGIRRDVYRELGTAELERPGAGIPKLNGNLDEINDHELMGLFVGLTRWTDYLQSEATSEEIRERYADAEVRKLEGLYMTANKPERVSEAVTWVRAQMELDPGVQSARDVLRVAYARRKLKQMLFESTERDAAVVSRELTRRTDARSPGYRRADRGAP